MLRNCECSDCSDWETTGQDEMNELYQKTQRPTVVSVRDRLNRLSDLVTVTRESLAYSELTDIKDHVGNVIYFHIEEQIKLAEQELRYVSN